jgi:formylglycine-generating enzyme required for sulfatase activity
MQDFRMIEARWGGGSRLKSKKGVAMFANFVSIGLLGALYYFGIADRSETIEISEVTSMPDIAELSRDENNASTLKKKIQSTTTNRRQADFNEARWFFGYKKTLSTIVRSEADSLETKIHSFRVLAHRAQVLGVEDLSYDMDPLSNDEGSPHVETMYAKYSDKIAEIENAIKKNKRRVVVGSNAQQIENALRQCQLYSQECDKSWYEDELERVASLRPFALDITEVTVSQFKQFVDQYKYVTDAEMRGTSYQVAKPYSDYAVISKAAINWRNTYAGQSASLPVAHVTLKDSSSYCVSVQKRLPTEAEWEYVAGSQKRLQYPWGQQWDESKLNWRKDNDSVHAKPVASYPATELGHYDLAGGVSEWTSTKDPSQSMAFIKGASRFDTNAANTRIAVRRLESVDYSGEDVGFRCVKELESWPDLVPQRQQ